MEHRGRGRKLVLDKEKIIELASICSTEKDVALDMGCSVKHLSRHHREDFSIGRARSRNLLKRTAFRLATDPDNPDRVILIFLLKALCGMRDKDPFTGPYVPADQRQTASEEIKAMDAMILPPHLAHRQTELASEENGNTQGS
jgi:hypothetical protein